MSVVLRWSTAVMLCAISLMGCAQMPSRGLLARWRTPGVDEFREEISDESFADDATILGETSDEWPTTDLTARLSKVSDRATDFDDSAVEAPSPIPKSSTPPNLFVADSQTRPIGSAAANPTSNDSGLVIQAGYESSSGANSTGIELMAGKSTAPAAPNPWERFRGLTKNLDATESGASNTPDLRTTAANVSAEPSRPSNSPEPWPRSPGNRNSAATAMTPSQMQWVNAEQSGANAAPIAATFPPQAFAPTSNLPLNLGLPDGAPLAIAPLVTSQELERLLMQTTVEAAAVTPGDNELSRQLYLRKHVQLRLLQLIAGQTDRALQPIPGIDSADQEFWQQMVWGMANYFDTQGMPDSSERATQTITQLRAATTRLQEKARLELRNVAFCHKISGFGNYQRFSRDQFTSGQPVLLYAEVADFKSEPTADGQFRTLMKSTLEILEAGPNGRLVETLPLSPSEDRCRNPRRDYYHSYEFSIPPNCTLGPHTLRLRVEDQLGKKTAITTLNFSVH